MRCQLVGVLLLFRRVLRQLFGYREAGDAAQAGAREVVALVPAGHRQALSRARILKFLDRLPRSL